VYFRQGVQGRKSVALGRLVRLTLKKNSLRYVHPCPAGLDCLNASPTYLGEEMAHVVETAIVHGVEGKSRAQQIARLKEWKKHFLSEGVEKVVLSEVGPGNMDGTWILAIHHKSGAAFGASFDSYYKNPKTFDSLMEKWSKTPTIKMASFAVTFVVDDF
jgi:hypothetical protein